VAAALYALRGGSAYVDITAGANGYYATHKGYDNVTGLGVPDVANLVKALQ
jgi:kumamolisin